MDRLPPEVLRMICGNLQFQDTANVRFLNRALSIVAAEFLITRVRFHTSRSSLDRLETISKHPVFSNTVKSLVFEASLLASIPSRDEYAAHFELDHHGLEKPDEPPPNCTDREKRLYQRNLAKWTHNIYAKFDRYRVLFASQQALLENNVLEATLSQCVPRFQKLEFVEVDPIRRCAHMASKRFIAEFGYDCALPLGGSFGRLASHFESMFLPQDTIIATLRRLEINSLSPSFFKQSRKDLLKAAFSRLTDINITLTLSDKDIESGESFKDAFNRHLLNGVIKDTLASAESLESVIIGVESPLLSFVKVSDVFPQATWKNLKMFGLSALSSTQCEFIDLMKRQPNLKHIEITMMQLTSGIWMETLQQMRESLDLISFTPAGFLEDSQESWPMDLISMRTYRDTFEEFDLSDAINLYVVERDVETPNPLDDLYDEFEDADIVRDMYGHLSDDDMSIDSNEDMFGWEFGSEDDLESDEEFDSDDDDDDGPVL